MSAWDAQRAQLRPAQHYERKVTCTEVNVFCGPGSKSPMTLKKSRRDKRESHSSRGLLDDSHSRKLRERPSWLSISRQPSSSLGQSGSWKQVTCHLHDNAGEANLQLFTEDQHLQHSVHVNSLFGPNVRIVDPTLLSRRHVLAIHGHTPMSASASTSTSTPTPCDPIYLEFRTRETLNSWLVLLRSFARPDVRSHPYSSFSLSPSGSYRMWRHLQVQVIAARRFPTKAPPERISSDESNSKDHDKEDKDVWEVYFEPVLNGASVGRTALKFVPASAWQAERIVVMDPDVGGGTWAGASGADADFGLAGPEWSWGIDPPVTSAFLEVRVWRSKSSSIFGFPSTTHIASVPIDLGPFRRGEPVKAWWPGFNQVSGQQDGELMMEIKFDEEIVLPLEDYQKMKEVLARRNYFELWQGLTARVPIPVSTSTHLISLALHQGVLATHLSELASTEINCPDTKPSTLFRGNSLLTRVAEPTMSILGARGFLEASLGHVVRKMYHDKVIFDFGTGGPAAGSATAAGVIEGADLMAYWLHEIWNSIWRARNECPEELRQLFYHIRTSVDNRWGSSSVHTDLKYQAISAFLFLRFFVPALLRPDQHSLVVGPPPEGVEKSLKSLARALQSLANLNTREDLMRSVRKFNEENVDAMIDYLIFVSSPTSSLYPHHVVPQSRTSASEHQIRAALQARLPALSPLHRESLPVLPYMTDEARDLAVIASAVVRNARTAEHPGRNAWQEVGPMNERLEDLGNQSRIGDPGDEQNVDTTGQDQSELQQDVVQFIKACFDVQTEVMRRVAPPTPGTGVGKKPARRRKRRTEDTSTRVEERLSLGTSTPSVEGGSVDGRESGQMPASVPGPSASTGVEYLTVRSEVLRSLPIEPSVKPDIVRQPSNQTVSSDTKKSRGIIKLMGFRK